MKLNLMQMLQETRDHITDIYQFLFYHSSAVSHTFDSIIYGNLSITFMDRVKFSLYNITVHLNWGHHIHDSSCKITKNIGVL